MPGGKVNLYWLLHQRKTEEEQITFLQKHKLIPEKMTCLKCSDTLKQVYPLFSKASKFKYYTCPCNPSEKISLTKNTLLYGSDMHFRHYIVLIFGFCYRFKYADMKCEADLEVLKSQDSRATQPRRLVTKPSPTDGRSSCSVSARTWSTDSSTKRLGAMASRSLAASSTDGATPSGTASAGFWAGSAARPKSVSLISAQTG